MEHDRQMDLALWRYGIISPLLHRDANDVLLGDLLQILSENRYIHPLNGRHISVGAEAIRKWFYRYNHGGFTALADKQRSDKGQQNVPQPIADAMFELRKDYPRWSLALLLRRMVQRKLWDEITPSRSVLYRFARANTLMREPHLDDCRCEGLYSNLVRHKDRSVLEQWRKSKNKRKWEKAVVILESNNLSMNQISAKIERPVEVVRKWIKVYDNHGIKGIEKKRKIPDRSKYDKIIIEKKNRILEILHQNPRLFGINRTNWNCKSISNVYKKEYGENIHASTVARYLRNNSNYKIGKSRKVLTSPDPNYREKVDLLLKILHSLKPEEMLFFIDELGPLRVKKYGGRCYIKKGEVLNIPQTQISKGSVTLYGALSATTNQVTWSYGNTKNSSGMIDLVETLFNQFHDKSKLYITWDAASWHSSNELLDWLDCFNAETSSIADGPIIEFIPLPSNSQFLNVIESVFGGMKKAVIHHSNYQSE